MLKEWIKKGKTLAAAVIILLALVSQQFFTVRAVVPSTVDYLVFLNGTKIFLHNKELLNPKEGTEVYFTYTIKSISKKCQQNGLVLTADAKRAFPYTEGGFMRYQAKEVSLLDEGATYFIKMTVASGGFRYEITKAKGEALENIVLEKRIGDATDQAKYLGIWLAGFNVEATFTNVRCYDKNGNDLGIEIACGSGTADVIRQDLHFDKANDIDHRYDITVDNKFNVAISNVKQSTTANVYIQYKVESAEYALNQNGVALSDSPKSEYPHGNGYLKYIQYPQDEKVITLLEPGAEYIIKAERKESDLALTVQKTKNGNREIFILSKPYGEYKKEYQYFSLWFGTGEKRMTFHLTDFLIYDENRNNLAVQTNVDSTIRHHGELEDYSGCEATYYCKENGNFIALYKDQTMKFTSQGKTEEVPYTVSQNILTADFSSGRQKYDYLFKQITDSDKNVYERLFTYKVWFVTDSDTEIPVQVLSNETGYLAARPSDPVRKGCTFEGWVTSDDKAFDFNQVITASTTLYAKWSGDTGANYTKTDHNSVSSILNTALIVGSAVLLAAGLILCAAFIKKGLKK